ncbi:MAG TPA: DUF5010 domain-containing protein [Arachidicoccus soli]|nr:DUF5010 domain-containing protein [Arachidicoccus soli]
MNKLFVLSLFSMSFFTFIPETYSQDVGATFAWQYLEIYGGHSYPFNQSIVKERMPDAKTHWSDNPQWWENMVEEVDYSGIDFLALLSRGTQPGRADLGTGDPKHITTLVNYMNQRNAGFKLGIFDDCPNSWTGSRNYHLFAKDNSKYELFDCANTDNYKYIWDYNLKIAIANIPDNKRYKIDGKMVLIFWSAKPVWMKNLQGNLSKILAFIKTQCQNTYGFTPYIIVDKSWFDNDSSLNTTTVDAKHSWFSAKGGTSYTLTAYNGVKTGVCVPSFVKPAEPSNGILYPYTRLDGTVTNDNGTRLRAGLDETVKSGARLTLVEGFTDAAEGAALWRSSDEGQLKYYDYPNQRLNILRRYTSNPYPNSLKMEVEACDLYADLSTGNSGLAFLDRGDLDVVKCDDTNGGWNVTNTEANEWMEWKELPLVQNTKFQLRYKSSAISSIKFSVDGTTLSTISLPSTDGNWTTIDAGNFTSASKSLHTVRLAIVSGSPDINYFSANNMDVITSNGPDVKENADGKSVSIYPNPYKDGILFIDLTGLETLKDIKVKVIDIGGKVLQETWFKKSSHLELSLSGTLKPSIYFIIIETGKTQVVKKLIVE